MKKFISLERIKSNLLALLSIANDDMVLAGLSWYSEARAYSKMLAKRHGVPVAKVAAIISALSPSNPWEKNKHDAMVLLQSYDAGLTINDFKVTTYGNNKIKAWDIAKDEGAVINGGINYYARYFTPDTKTHNFYLNILGEQDGLTIDGHAINAAMFGLKRIGINSVDASLRKGSISRIKTAYRQVAREQGYEACVLQAIIWTVYRSLPTSKGE